MSEIQISIPQDDLVAALKRSGLLPASAQVTNMDVTYEERKLELEVTFVASSPQPRLRRLDPSDPPGTAVHVLLDDGTVSQRITDSHLYEDNDGTTIVSLQRDLLATESYALADLCLVVISD